uniref:Uncharacterized protein n=1 Tax=candidate division CPR3 bacterium TaxID=2268181 RepID=A0A7C4LZQ2_UNCC3
MKKTILLLMFFCFSFSSSVRSEWFCPVLGESSIKQNSKTGFKYRFSEINAEVFLQGSWEKTKGYSSFAKVTFYDKLGKKLFEYDSNSRSHDDMKFFLTLDGYPSFCIGTYDKFRDNDKPLLVIMTAGPSVKELFDDLGWSKKERGFFFSTKSKEVNFYLQILKWFPDGEYWEVVYRVFTPPMNYDQKDASEKAMNQAISSLEKNIGIVRSAFLYASKGDVKNTKQYFGNKLSSKSQSKILKDNKNYLAKIARGETSFEYFGWGSNGTIYFEHCYQENCNTESVFLESGKINEASFYDEY